MSKRSYYDASYTYVDASIPVLTDALTSLQAILKKGEEHPDAEKFLEARIFEDMLPLTFQVHFSTDIAQKFVARATGTEPLTLQNDFKSYADLFERIKLVLKILDEADGDTINGRLNEDITIGLGPGKMGVMQSREFLGAYVLPNVFFHVTTAYNILRMQGIPLGKGVYLSPFLDRHVHQK